MLSVFEIGQKITIARKLKNFSQAQLAELLAVSAQAVGKWERGESMPDIITFGLLAEILGVDLNYFSGKDKTIAYSNDNYEKIEENDSVQNPGWNISSGNWVDVDFSGLHGLAEKLKGSNIEKCKCINTELSGLMLKGNNIRKSDFSHSDLNKCTISGTNIDNNIFVDCDFECSKFIRSSIKNCDFSKTNLMNVTSKWCVFKNIILSEAVLKNITFQSTQLTEIRFDSNIVNCSYENCDFTRVVFQGVTIRNTFFKNSKLNRIKFMDCKIDKLSYAFMKTCKADLSDVFILES